MIICIAIKRGRGTVARRARSRVPRSRRSRPARERAARGRGGGEAAGRGGGTPGAGAAGGRRAVQATQPRSHREPEEGVAQAGAGRRARCGDYSIHASEKLAQDYASVSSGGLGGVSQRLLGRALPRGRRGGDELQFVDALEAGVD